MGLLLDLVYLCVSIVASPWIAYRITRTRSWSTLSRRLGTGLPEDARGCVWLHASSVGEVSLLKPLVRRLEAERPDLPLVISTFTRTGHEAARASYAAHDVIYLPLDISFVVARFLRRLDPSVLVIVESELWPNLLGAALKRDTAIALLNARMSARSCRVHARMRLVPRLLKHVRLIAAQNDEHAARFRALGVPDARLFVTGNMKYDLAGGAEALDSRASLRSELSYGDADVVVIGGSLHAGEERALLEAHQRLARSGHTAALILVPRYPDDAAAVAEEARRTAGGAVRQTDIDAGRARAPGSGAVLVVDVMGRLGGLYAAADIAFVGGSLYYRGAGKGGHNLMEPAILGVPVLFGPFNASFKDTVDDLLREDAAACVTDTDELVGVLRQWLVDPDRRAAIGQRGKRIIERGQGATQRNLELLLGLARLEHARLQGAADPSTMPPAAGDSEIR